LKIDAIKATKLKRIFLDSGIFKIENSYFSENLQTITRGVPLGSKLTFQFWKPSIVVPWQGQPQLIFRFALHHRSSAGGGREETYKVKLFYKVHKSVWFPIRNQRKTLKKSAPTARLWKDCFWCPHKFWDHCQIKRLTIVSPVKVAETIHDGSFIGRYQSRLFGIIFWHRLVCMRLLFIL